MASPVYSAGTPGNLINGVVVVHGVPNAVAAFLDLSTAIEGQVTVDVVIGASPPTVLATYSVYKVYAGGSVAPITLTAGAASGQTSVSLTSKTGLVTGQKVLLQQASSPKVGEIVTISTITGSGSPYTLTTTANLINSYLLGDGLYYMSQASVFSVQPSSLTGAYVASTDYSAVFFLGPGQYVVGVVNSDASNSFTTNTTVDKITAIQ